MNVCSRLATTTACNLCMHIIGKKYADQQRFNQSHVAEIKKNSSDTTLYITNVIPSLSSMVIGTASTDVRTFESAEVRETKNVSLFSRTASSVIETWAHSGSPIFRRSKVRTFETGIS